MYIPVHTSCLPTSMFEEILEQFSSRDEVEQQAKQINLLSSPPQLPLQESYQETTELWLAVNEELKLCFLETNEEEVEKMSDGLRHVQQLREEQESKLKELTRLRQNHADKKDYQDTTESSLYRYSKSLSPRKTKRIDKRKTLRLLSEDF